MTTSNHAPAPAVTSAASEPDAMTGTAAQWSQHFLADSIAQGLMGRHILLERCDREHPDPALVLECVNAYHQAANSFLLGFLLRHVSDEVAQEAAQIADSSEYDEWSWQYLADAGLDPTQIVRARTAAETLAEGRRQCEAQPKD